MFAAEFFGHPEMETRETEQRPLQPNNSASEGASLRPYKELCSLGWNGKEVPGFAREFDAQQRHAD